MGDLLLLCTASGIHDIILTVFQRTHRRIVSVCQHALHLLFDFGTDLIQQQLTSISESCTFAFISNRHFVMVDTDPPEIAVYEFCVSQRPGEITIPVHVASYFLPVERKYYLDKVSLLPHAPPTSNALGHFQKPFTDSVEDWLLVLRYYDGDGDPLCHIVTHRSTLLRYTSNPFNGHPTGTSALGTMGFGESSCISQLDQGPFGLAW